MLVKCYNRVGLSTPRNQVLALASSPPSTIAAARAPAPAPPALTTQTAQTKPRVQKNVNIAQFLNRGGLTTSQSQVLALTNSPSPAVAATGTPAPGPPALTTRTVQTKPSVQKNANIA
jgi:hypothetical protein